jgi:N-acetylmuramoyl-L-alanine amidase
MLCPVPVQASISHHQSEIEFARATAIQRRLEATPDRERTPTQYERALDAYRSVYHSDPASPDAARSIAAVADLLTSEGREFHDAKLLRDAVAQWEFLRRQYPTSSLRQRALFEQAEIQQHDLHDRSSAKKSYRAFLAQYPHDALAEKARAGLENHPVAEASTAHAYLAKPAEATAVSSIAQTPPAPAQPATIQPSSPSPVVWIDNDPDSKPTRPAPKTAAAGKPSNSAQTANTAKATPTIAIVKDVRYWDENGSTRLAIDLSDAVSYHTYSVQNGRQITVIFFGAQSAQALLDHPIVASHDENVRSMRVSMLTADQATLVLELRRPVSFNSFVLSNPSRLILDLQPALTSEFVQVAAAPINRAPTLAAPIVPARTGVAPRPGPSATPLEETKQTFPVPTAAADGTEATPDVQPSSMSRVLGLRVRRIVIDAGHGGHDSGTIGPGGVEEKDIALDVALRLGHLLQQRLGAEVIYTRSSDKYVPLQDRTAIANAAHADLFLSIHANSSSDVEVRGIETYFLNFTNAPDAMAVAGRENAGSNRSVYELSDLVRKIALSDKIDESRQFAGDVQQQLYSGLLFGNPGLKNRGVKQAPFVVLIGAQMPSILAEISFLTNPTDAAELSRPRYRERLAEALYRGVAEYVDGMSGIRIAKTIPTKPLAAPAE